MKRTTLQIAIVTIAAVGIAVGILVSGAGLAGTLQGRLEPVPTTLTLGITLDTQNYPVGVYGLILHGRLVDATGAPVANRPVTLRYIIPGETVIHDAGTATTGADGSYTIQHIQGVSYNGNYPVYYAEFAGVDMFLASRSSDVQGP